MSLLLYAVVGIVVLVILVAAAQALLRYWEDQVHLTEEDLDLEHRVKALNDELANRRSDEEIVRILSGEESPTLARRRRKQS